MLIFLSKKGENGATDTTESFPNEDDVVRQGSPQSASQEMDLDDLIDSDVRKTKKSKFKDGAEESADSDEVQDMGSMSVDDVVHWLEQRQELAQYAQIFRVRNSTRCSVVFSKDCN